MTREETQDYIIAAESLTTGKPPAWCNARQLYLSTWVARARSYDCAERGYSDRNKPFFGDAITATQTRADADILCRVVNLAVGAWIDRELMLCKAYLLTALAFERGQWDVVSGYAVAMLEPV